MKGKMIDVDCELYALLLGFKGPESVLPMIWRQFHSLRKHYPSETYMQAPLLGLYEYGYRFGLMKPVQ